MNLNNHFLIATPNLGDPRFHQAVVLICEHSEEGTMGLVLNHDLDIGTEQIFEQLNLPTPSTNSQIFCGGPVNEEIGFILHDSTKEYKSSLALSKSLTLTTSSDILEDIANEQFLGQWRFYLGYSGWSTMQLEDEISENAWLTCKADKKLVLNTPADQIWKESLLKLGISDPSKLFHAGHA